MRALGWGRECREPNSRTADASNAAPITIENRVLTGRSQISTRSLLPLLTEIIARFPVIRADFLRKNLSDSRSWKGLAAGSQFDISKNSFFYREFKSLSSRRLTSNLKTRSSLN